MKHQRKANTVTDLLMEQAMDPAIPTAKLQAELRASGIDIDGILKKSSVLIGERVRQHYAELARQQQAQPGFAQALQHFAVWPLDRVKQWLQELAEGQSGPEAQALAQPCFRNKSSAEMSETEVRNLAAEVKATIDAGNGRKSV